MRLRKCASMQFAFDSSDDPEVIEALMEAAKHMRRRRDARGALTAAKCEIVFSKAIQTITGTQPDAEAPKP